MARREFQLIDGTSQKFWAIQLNGNSFTVHYGRIGTGGQAQEKSFADETAASAAADKLILEKTKKGYAEVADGTTGASGSAPTPKAAPEAKPAEDAKKSAGESATPAQSAPAGSTAPIAEVASPATIDRRVDVKDTDLPPSRRASLPPIPKPASPAFDLADGLQRLRTVGDMKYQWQEDWRKAKIPDFPSPEEAQFWMLACRECRTGNKTMAEAADALANVRLDGKMSTDELLAICSIATWHESTSLLPCIMALAPLQDLVERDWESQYSSVHEFAEAFGTLVLPFLSLDERDRIRELVRRQIKPGPPSNPHGSWPAAYYIGAVLGCHDEILALLRSLPDGYHKSSYDHYLHPQELLFSLGDGETVGAEGRRLEIKLHTKEQARTWLALTGYSALDVIVASTCAAQNKEWAAHPASALLLVTAPEAAIPALQLLRESKAPQVGMEWMNRNPFLTVVGFVPVATSGHGKLAEAAREHLRTLRRGPSASLLTAALPHLAPEHAAWLQSEIIDSNEESVPEITREEIPEPLRTALESTKAAKPPGWLTVEALPPVKIGGKKVSVPDIERILSELKATPLGGASVLLTALKEHAEPHALDAFAWRLFDFWLTLGAASKDKWTMAAIGHLGGDGSVLKLTPLVRDWPGESQHQRAVFGLECLRAVGTDTALMALNGIAQKLKFKGLKEKAQAMMEAIAQSRSFTREQLADRIVPDCGLDERGSRIFDFGPRQFRFVLGPEMKPLVRDAAGKTKPDLPNPNGSDDTEKAEAAVAAWKLLKKTLREVLKVQAERLEDAMITGRRWSAEEFSNLLVKQPLMINLVRQFVWAAYDATGNMTRTFRVTEDQTLADQNDDEINLPAAAQIGLVHPAQLDDATKGAWGQILSDYEIIPPFQQLGRAICRPEPEDLEAREITRYRGPKVPGIVMYGMLEGSHWLRDSPADGGGFMQHSKHFPSSTLTAFIQYSGLSIGYYDEAQELEAIYFVPGHAKPDWWGKHDNRMKIGEVAPVVMSEVLRLANAIISKAE